MTDLHLTFNTALGIIIGRFPEFSYQNIYWERNNVNHCTSVVMRNDLKQV